MLRFCGSGCGAPRVPAQQLNTHFNSEACVVGQQKKVCLQCEWLGCLFALTECWNVCHCKMDFLYETLSSVWYSYSMKHV